MAETKVGRNDPCTCGSGKKYKHCCLVKEWNSPEHQHRIMVRAEERVRDKIHSFAASGRFDEELDRAYKIFFDGKYDIKNQEERPPEVAQVRFYDWYLFDYEFEDWEKPPIQIYQEVRGYNLDEDEKKLLEDWQETISGAFEVSSIDRETHEIELKHLFNDETVTVTDESIIENVEESDICITRLIKMADTHIFSGSYTRLAPDAKDDLLNYLNGEYEDLKSENADATWHDFFKARAPQVNLYLTRIEEKAAEEEKEKEAAEEETAAGESK